MGVPNPPIFNDESPPQPGDALRLNSAGDAWEPFTPSGASGPFVEIVAPWTYQSTNIETIGFVVGQLLAGDIPFKLIEVTSTDTDVASTYSVHVNSASGADLLNGGTLDIGTGGDADVFVTHEVNDGQRGVKANCNVVIVLNDVGNAQGAGTFHMLVYRPS